MILWEIHLSKMNRWGKPLECNNYLIKKYRFMYDRTWLNLLVNKNNKAREKWTISLNKEMIVSQCLINKKSNKNDKKNKRQMNKSRKCLIKSKS
jgi:tRNA A22 N-methylase